MIKFDGVIASAPHRKHTKTNIHDDGASQTGCDEVRMKTINTETSNVVGYLKKEVVVMINIIDTP